MAITWIDIEKGGSRAVYYSAPGTDTFAKLTTDGVPLSMASGFTISAWADPGSTITSATLQAWVWDPLWFTTPPALNTITPAVATPGAWARCPDLDITISATLGQQGYFSQGSSPGIGIPMVVKKGTRVAYVPSAASIVGGGGMLIIHSVSGDRLGH